MKNTIIELTDTDNQKFLINVLKIVWIEPTKGGTSIRMEEYSFPKKVRESYEEIKALIKALDS
ncbi:MAG: hypothetical protein MUF36_07000 [Bacteroidales bacterium]|jgi:hypothetical protein|nr:hypothetical protein [Bacteroidales bacterium]